MASFERRLDGKADALFHTSTVAGAKLADVLAASSRTPSGAADPKVMRWGDGDATFVRRPWVTLLHGADVVPGRVLDHGSGRTTRGHRFIESRGDIEIATADAYEPTLLAEGKVIPDFAERRANIERQLAAEAARAPPSNTPTCSTKSPRWSNTRPLYVGEFEAEFLAVPQECLILTMRANQKYFPLFDAPASCSIVPDRLQHAGGRPDQHRRRQRPRGAPAPVGRRFFFEQDIRPASRRALPSPGAGGLSQQAPAPGLERVERLRRWPQDRRHAAGRVAACEPRRAALQGRPRHRHGRRVPRAAGHHGTLLRARRRRQPVVADAIEAHYQPRFAGDALPDR